MGKPPTEYLLPKWRTSGFQASAARSALLRPDEMQVGAGIGFGGVAQAWIPGDCARLLSSREMADFTRNVWRLSSTTNVWVRARPGWLRSHGAVKDNRRNH